ncbi:MAG: preprotein translocase subunit YajC [Firmicutes bacterium]|nr:preprotein translocase subunit YajC [Bacillota bacterium]
MERIAGFFPIILLFVIFYFFVIRPQQQQQKKRREMLAGLQKGDKIITIGGIYGVIKDIKDDELTVQVSDSVNIKFARYGVDRVLSSED